MVDDDWRLMLTVSGWCLLLMLIVRVDALRLVTMMLVTDDVECWGFHSYV